MKMRLWRDGDESMCMVMVNWGSTKGLGERKSEREKTKISTYQKYIILILIFFLGKTK